PEFLALGRGSDGKTYLFSGNAGTNDVSVMDLHQALAGAPVVEVAPRVPVQTGPFGIKASPNGKFIAVTARESGQADFEGNTISIIDVDRARAGAAGAEAPRVRVGRAGSGVRGAGEGCRVGDRARRARRRRDGGRSRQRSLRPHHSGRPRGLRNAAQPPFTAQ